MAQETTVFLGVIILALAHLLAPVLFKFSQNSFSTMIGPQDDLKPLENLYGQRLERANNNFKETLPLALGLLIMVHVLEKQGGISVTGAWLYLGARILYPFMFLSGIPMARTTAWAASIVGLGMMAAAIAS